MNTATNALPITKYKTSSGSSLSIEHGGENTVGLDREMFIFSTPIPGSVHGMGNLQLYEAHVLL